MSTPASISTAIPAPRPATSSTTVPRVLLTVEAAAEQLSIGRTTMYTLLKEGQIRSVRVGRLRRIPAEAVQEFTARLVDEQTSTSSAA